MTGCLVRTFGGEILCVPDAIIKNTCLIVFRLLSLRFRLFTASRALNRRTRGEGGKVTMLKTSHLAGE